MPNWDAYAEAEKRGILKDDKLALYNEAKKRGLVPGFDNAVKQNALTPLQQSINRKYEESQTGRPIPQLSSADSAMSTPLKSRLGELGPEKEVPKSLTVMDVLNAVDNGLDPTSNLETAANLITSSYGMPASGVAGLATLAATQDLGKAERVMEGVQKATVYQPHTELGKQKTEAIGNVVGIPAKIGKSITGEFIDTEKHPNLAALAETTITGIPALLMLKGVGKSNAIKVASKIEAVIDTGIKKSTPFYKSGKYTPKQLKSYMSKATDAVKEIVSNKDILEYTDAAGNKTYGLPKNRAEFSQAISQVKDNIFKQYDLLANDAKAKGAMVDLSPVVRELNNIIEDPVLVDRAKGVVKYAKEVRDSFIERGVYDPIEAQRAIKIGNESLQRYRKTGAAAEGDVAFVDEIVNDKLRSGLDSAIENITGKEYQPLKNKYGALRAIEDDVMGSVLKSARQKNKGLIDYADMYGVYHATKGLINLDPATLAGSAMLKATKIAIKRANNQDLIVKNMFSKVDKLMEQAKK